MAGLIPVETYTFILTFRLIPVMGKNFSFSNYRYHSLQLEEAHANEINHDIHLANTLC